MLYTNQGSQIDVVAHYGSHRVKGFKYHLTLIAVRFQDDMRERYRFAEFLRASQGITEIQDAIAAAPRKTLTGVELKAAIEQAT